MGGGVVVEHGGDRDGEFGDGWAGEGGEEEVGGWVVEFECVACI